METPGKKSSNKWLIGLGIGCGGAIVLLIIIGIGGYFFVRNMTQGFRESQALMRTLEEKYGRPEAYVPGLDGVIAAGRMEAFLAVREAAAPVRQSLEESLETLVKDQQARETEGRRARNVFSSIRAGIGTIPQFSGFVKARSQALLDQGMGLGEYYYLYAIAYYAWLKKSPEDGAGVDLRGGGFSPGDRAGEDARDVSRDMTLRRVHREILPMLENLLAKLRSGAGSGGGGAADKWTEALAVEVKLMETDRYRVPFQDGVPEVIEKSLRPFRERLEKSYSRATNLFEFILQER
jgi:hypothetical protein